MEKILFFLILTHSCCKPQAISSKSSELKLVLVPFNSIKYDSNVMAFSVTT